jgi:hypothetical protein
MRPPLRNDESGVTVPMLLRRTGFVISLLLNARLRACNQ